MPDKQKLFYAVALSAITLGTAWAVRGQFGHTQGAAWAGAFCALVIILLSGRTDWLDNAFTLSSASALGWGVGGIISYGLVVAYGQGLDFPNVYYGLTMLFFIGGLFGFLGGGLFAVALGNSERTRVNWWSLAAQMLLGALATHLMLVQTLGLRLTPPRGDGWAACLGMALMLWWYLRRKRLMAEQRVALLGALGAGWGFAFGNFLRVAGISANIRFNHWNVMEYSIGFFGAAAVAYAVFTSQWPDKNARADNADNRTHQRQHRAARIAAVLLLAGFIPFIVWQQSFTTERITRMLQDSGLAANAERNANGSLSVWVTLIQAAVLICVIAAAALALRAYGFCKNKRTTADADNNGQSNRPSGASPCAYRAVKRFFALYMTAFIALSFLITGAFFSTRPTEQFLYPLNLIAVLLLVDRVRPGFTPRSLNTRRWLLAVLVALAVLAALGYASIHMHGELWGTQKRFP